MKRLSKIVCGLSMAAALLPTAVGATNGALVIGHGVKSQGMGGVGIAYPQDSFSAAANPAGIVELGGRFDLGLHYLNTDGRFKTDGAENTDPDLTLLNSGFRSDESTWLPEVGTVWMLSCNQAIGLAFHQLGTWRVKSNQLFTVRPSWPSPTEDRELCGLRSTFDIYAATAAWSYQFSNCHSFGVAVSAVGGRLDVDARGLILPSETVNEYALFRGAEWQWGVNARFGWLGQFCDCFAMGLTYQTRTWMDRYSRYEGFIPERGHVDLTSQVGFGMTWCVFPCLTVSGEAVKVFWDYGRWFENTQMRDRGLFGANNGRGLGWNDQVVLKLGAEWAISNCLLARIGYNYGNTTLPDGALFNMFTFASVEHHLTFGATWTFCSDSELSLFYYRGFDNDVRGLDPGFPAGASFAPTNKVRAKLNAAGVSYGYRF